MNTDIGPEMTVRGYGLLLCCLLFSSVGWSQSRLHLETSLVPPYQVMINGQLRGSAVAVLQCALQQLQMTYTASIVPWKRAKQNLRAGYSDGFFSVMSLPEMAPYARLSAPLMLEKWYWFAFDDKLFQRPGFPSTVRIGVLRGSNQEGWLLEHQIPIAQSVNQLPSLIRLLSIRRIDTLLVDRQVMADALEHQTGLRQPLAEQFERYAPLGVYYSNSFLSSNPGFMQRFNDELTRCNVGQLQLSQEEDSALRLLALQDSAELRSAPDLLRVVQEANVRHENLSPGDIQLLDVEWQRVIKAQQPQPEWISRVLQNPQSQHLKAWLANQEGRYTEVFIADAQGLLVASATATSDYWQGDEEKFIRPLALAAKPENAHQVISWIDTAGTGAGIIHFDDSTKQFLSHLSYPLWQPGVSHPVGVLTLGLNIEQVLRQK